MRKRPAPALRDPALPGPTTPGPTPPGPNSPGLYSPGPVFPALALRDSRSPELADRSAPERILEVARELFCRDGIHATGIDRILAQAGASKMTLYTRFGSKEALVREVLQREGAEWRAAFFAAVAGDGGAAVAQLRRVIPALSAWFSGGRFYGCSFMNAAAEHSKGEPVLREMASQHHRHVLDFLEDLTARAGLPQPALAARQILLTIDGAIAALMVAGDGTVLEVASRNLELILMQPTGRTTT